ncbi:MAG: hypothetical protein K2G88_05700 [Oscillospiraceae bacterium]|nr:hypothetical protein [Oscillospiraceae bacterium]
MSKESQKNNIHKGHRNRFRNRYKKSGIEALEEHEILEMLLYYAVPRRNTNPSAHELLDKFGSVKGVVQANIPDLMTIDGVGDATATFLNFIGDLFNYCSRQENTSCVLKNFEEYCEYFLNELQNEVKREVLVVACLDNSMCVRRCSKLGIGDSDSLHFDIQNLTSVILESGCKNVILAHNHLSGDATPSYEDIQSTKYIKSILEKLGIYLIDHVIIADKKACSMAELNAI